LKKYFTLPGYRATVPNINVAVLGVPEYAKGIGKRSTASDITFYDVKQGDVTISMIEPSRYPEKLSSLFHATSLADLAIVVVDRVGPEFGETAVTLDCLGLDRGILVLRNYITADQISPLIKGSVLEKYRITDDDPIGLRQTLLSEAQGIGTASSQSDESAGSVAVDHYFDVKGVGTVALGCVANGVIRRHDEVKVLPAGADAEIRSIQKHDDDFEIAVRGDRVGLALKGVSVSDLDRGTVLTNDPALTVRSDVSGEARLVKYWMDPIKEGMVLHVGHWMQFEPARVEAVVPGKDWRSPVLRLRMHKDLVYSPGSKAIVTYLEGGKLRVVGTMELL